jgi:hypothetical protein
VSSRRFESGHHYLRSQIAASTSILIYRPDHLRHDHHAARLLIVILLVQVLLQPGKAFHGGVALA